MTCLCDVAVMKPSNEWSETSALRLAVSVSVSIYETGIGLRHMSSTNFVD